MFSSGDNVQIRCGQGGAFAKGGFSASAKCLSHRNRAKDILFITRRRQVSLVPFSQRKYYLINFLTILSGNCQVLIAWTAQIKLCPAKSASLPRSVQKALLCNTPFSYILLLHGTEE